MISNAISCYRIIEKLGAGGMGVVYCTEDTKLDRQVSIKVLPDIFSGDAERQAAYLIAARFQDSACIASSWVWPLTSGNRLSCFFLQLSGKSWIISSVQNSL